MTWTKLSLFTAKWHFLAEITFVDLVFSYQVGKMEVVILKFLSPSPKTNSYWLNYQDLSMSPTQVLP